MEERKLVTVLFADFVESTSLGARHDPEVVRAALGRTFAAIQEILVAHGGTVEKFIGDAVMAVFGIPVTHEDDALRALRAAFAIRKAVEEHGGGPSVALRIGVNSGEVVAGDGSRRDLLVTGPPVVLAARLQTACRPGEILVGSLTRRLTEADVRYGPPRRVEAKGIGEIDAHPAEHLVSAVGPRRRDAAGRARFVGREPELARLREAHRRCVREGRPRLVTVVGEPGVGKSRLVQEFVRDLGAERVRIGHCVAYGAGMTFVPIQEILAQDTGILPTDSGEEARNKLRDAVATALAQGDEADAVFCRLSVLASFATADAALPGVRTEDMPHELEWAARRYLEGRASTGPVTLVIEDAHWAEPGLLDAIDRIGSKVRGPVLVLCVGRPELLDTRPGWSHGGANAELLRLEPLDGARSARLAEALLPAAAPRVREAIIARGDGNPLFLEELARVQESPDRVDETIPANIHELIASRLDGAAPPVKRLLQRASVAGKVFWTDALVALGEDPTDLRIRTDEAARRGFVVELDERGPGGGWAHRFVHSLVRDVAYASVPKSERARLHDRFARWLGSLAPERREERADLIAYHAEQAYAYARDVGAEDQAALAARAFPALLHAARAARLRDDIRASRTLYGRAGSLAGPAGAPVAEALEAAGRAAIARLRLEGSSEAVVEIDRALTEARSAPPSPILASLLSWRGMYAQYESIERARRLHDEAVAIARSIEDPRYLPNALRVSATPAAFAGDLAGQRRILEEALPLIRATDAGGLVQCLAGLLENAWQRGDLASALRYLDEMTTAGASERGAARVVAAIDRARFARAIADPDAQRLAEHAVALARDLGAPIAIARASAVFGGVLRERGDLASARRVLEDADASAAATTRNPDVTMLRCELARTDAQLGDLVAARRQIERISAVPDTDVATRAYVQATIAFVASRGGERADAAAGYERARALLAPTDLAADRARLEAERGAFLVEAGRPAEARSALEVALAFYADTRLARRRTDLESLLARC